MFVLRYLHLLLETIISRLNHSKFEILSNPTPIESSLPNSTQTKIILYLEVHWFWKSHFCFQNNLKLRCNSLNQLLYPKPIIPDPNKNPTHILQINPKNANITKRIKTPQLITLSPNSTNPKKYELSVTKFEVGSWKVKNCGDFNDVRPSIYVTLVLDRFRIKRKLEKN